MMYFNTDILIDAITLSLNSCNPQEKEIIGKLCEIYEKKLRNKTVLEDTACSLLLSVLKELNILNVTIDDQKTIETFLLKFKTNTLLLQDPDLYTKISNIFNNKDRLSDDRVIFITRKIKDVLLWEETNINIGRMYDKMRKAGNSVDPTSNEVLFGDIKEICSTIIKSTDEQILLDNEKENTAKFVDSSDKDTMTKALEIYHKVAVANRFKTGLQGLNRALNGGFPLGSSIVINARSHQGKSLLLLKFARWAIQYNKVDESFKNPICLFFSLENETPQNLVQLFRELYISEHKALPPDDISHEEIVKYMYDEMQKFGWRLIIDRRLGSNFGFIQLKDAFEEYERKGFTPMMCVIDYANMMSKSRDGNSSESSSNNLMIKELYTNLCNYLKSKNCTFVTAHQLNRRADEVVSQNPIGAVKKFGPEMLSDSISVQREVDIVFYVNKESNSVGQSFLTFKLDKYRYESCIPDKFKYFAYPFKGELGLMDDINEADMSTDNIYTYPTDDVDNKNNKLKPVDDFVDVF